MGAMRATALALLLVLTAIAGAAAADDDNGSGTDAPDQRSGAWTVSEGWVNGTVSVFDEDWYRIDVNRSQVLHLHAEPSQGVVDLAVREADGFRIARLTDGQRISVVSSTGTLYIALSMDIGETDYALDVQLEAISADDGASGGDASNHWRYATNATGPSLEGVVGRASWDPADWFALPVPSDHWVEVRFQVPRASAILEVRDANGDLLGRSESSWGSWATVRAAPDTAKVLVGAVEPRSGIPYEVQVATSSRPDVAITGLTVQGADPDRTVSFTVSNNGPGPVVDGWLWTWVHHADRPADHSRVLLSEALDLASGASKTVTVPWDTLGEVGDGVLTAWAQTRFDLNASDDAAWRNVTILAGGTGHGADLLNNQAGAQLLLPHASLATHRDGAGTGLAATGGPGNADLWLEAHRRPDGTLEGRLAACSYAGPDQCAETPLPPGVGS